MAATASVLDKVDILGPKPHESNLEANFDRAPPPAPAGPPPGGPQGPSVGPPAPSFDPVKLKEKYLAERDKRLKYGGGISQYRLVEEKGQFRHYLDDPWVEPGFTREPVEEVVDVVIVGGGYGAQLVAVRLLEMGVGNVRLVEKAGGFGGTWYWNRYPGAQCDIESYIYMPLLEELGVMPTEKYARAKELLAHSDTIGKRYGLYDKTLFQTEVHAMRWDEETALWGVATSRDDKIRARFIIPAAGPLHRPKLPGVKGIEDFQGHSFHSSRWDYTYTGGTVNSHELTGLKDKKVAIIGTGATAVQIVPNVAKYAKELYVFQRTPSSIDVRGNKPTDPVWADGLEDGWQKERMDNFNLIVNGAVLSEDHVKDGWTDILQKLLARSSADSQSDPEKAAAERQIADFEKMEQVRARCDEVIKDKDVAESLKPWYNQLCKRPCFHDEYLQSFNNPNVHLIDTKGVGISHITPTGIVANSTEYEIDCIIYCTGFELATEWSHRSNIEMYGRNGQTITDVWKEGARTLHGWTTRNMPNCFWVSIVQAALTPNFLHVTGEQAKHLAYVVSEAMKRNVRTVEPTAQAEEDWVQTILKLAGLRAEFLKECTPGYYNNEGTPSLNAAKNAAYGGGSPAFLKILEDWRAKGDMEGLDLRYFDS